MACVHYATVAVGSVVCGALLSQNLGRPWILWLFIIWGVFGNLVLLTVKIVRGDFWGKPPEKKKVTTQETE